MSKNERDAARWQQLAIQLLEDVRCAVNQPSDIGGEYETGVMLMFFWKQKHNGKATFVSTDLPREEIKQILRTTLKKLDQAVIVSPGTKQ